MRRGLLLGGLVIAALIAAGGYLMSDDMVGERFDAAIWRAQQYSTAQDNPRAAMVADLEANHLRPGMTKAEVEALLGTPDLTPTATRYTYLLGASSLGVDEDYYIILFADDRVTDFYPGRS